MDVHHLYESLQAGTQGETIELYRISNSSKAIQTDTPWFAPLFDAHAHLHTAVDRLGHRVVTDRRNVPPEASIAVVDTWHEPHRFPSTDPAAGYEYPYLRVYTAFGCHPREAHRWNERTSRRIVRCLDRFQSAIAVGECGYDDARSAPDLQAQHTAFTAQAALAAEMSLPLVIHCRADGRDHTRWYQALRQNITDAGLSQSNLYWHSCTASSQTIRLFHRMFPNMYFGVSNKTLLCDRRRTQAASNSVPLERLLVESDAPHLLESPWDITNVIDALAEARGTPANLIRDCTINNAHRFYRV